MRLRLLLCGCGQPRADHDQPVAVADVTTITTLPAIATRPRTLEKAASASSDVWSKLNRSTSIDKSSSLGLVRAPSLIAAGTLGTDGLPLSDENRILKPSRSFNKNALSRTGSMKTRSSDAISNGSGSSDTPSTHTPSLLEASALRLAKSQSSSDDNSSSSPPSVATTGGDAVARSFGNLFVNAIVSRNGKWASETELYVLLHDNAKLITHDKQVFQGKTAIIRRLNAGMEQFVKMIEKHVPSAENLEQVVDKSSASIDVQATHKDSKHAGRHFTVTYTFKLGVRRFKFQDEMSIKDGQIKRLKRHRN